MTNEKTYWIICSFLILLLPSFISAQCNNNVQFPQGTLNAPVNEGDTALISDIQFAGDHSIMTGFTSNGEFVFTSSNANDFITLRTENRDSALAFGNTPLSYTIDSITTISIHINTSNPVCGNNTDNRTTQVIYMPAIMNVPHVGINQNAPEATLDINGKIKISDDNDAPLAGMIRWNPANNDFEGYDGNVWKSLTKANGNWGTIPQRSVNEINKITALDTSFSKEFGVSVDLHGSYAIIGAWREVFNGNQDQGAAYIFHQQGGEWVQQAKLIANDGDSFDNFGITVSIYNDKAVVGTSSHTFNGIVEAGAAYAFSFDGNLWNFDQKITASNASGFSCFGCNVSLYEDRLVIGAPYTNHNDIVDSGAAYIYEFDGSNWGNETIISALDAAVGDLFGGSVDIYENRIIVGAHRDDVSGRIDQGSAYIFEKIGNDWTPVAHLFGTQGASAEDDVFGSSVAIYGDYAIVGAPEENNSVDFLDGTAYIFIKDDIFWALQQKIEVAETQNFPADVGRSVAINNNYAVIGVSQRIVLGNRNQGSAFIYARQENEWCREVELLASDGKAFEKFGFALSLYDKYIMVGSYLDVLTGNLPTGSVYTFSKN